MNSIYTERENILPHHAEWLDGCGAKWCDGEDFSKQQEIAKYILFSDSGAVEDDDYYFFNEDNPKERWKHIPTGTEFCKRVAEILGLPKPTFGDDINVATTDPIKGMAIEVNDQVVDEQEERYYFGEGNKIYDRKKPEPIKGMAMLAIDFERLGKDQIQWLKENVKFEKDEVPFKFFNCVYLDFGHDGPTYIRFQNGSHLTSLGYTITESPTEFLEYVGKQTGKEYKATVNMNIVEGTPIPKFEVTTSQPYNTPNIVAPKLAPTYPHKTYRILDSLDNVPLDKRIPLSEWIPPFDKNVLFVMKDYFAMGRIWQIKEGYVCLSGDIGQRYQTLSKDLDGHWMRIV